MKLHLGVVDLPYASKDGQSTGDVADLLEQKYHIMELFFEEHGQKIADLIAQSMVDSFETALAHGGTLTDPFGGATSEIKSMFMDFLSLGQVEGLGIPGVPTAAAKKGVNHRLAHPYRKSNSRRPSFIDSGTYEAAFIAWIDEWPR